MTKDYRSGRQSAHLAMSDIEFNERFEAVELAFGEQWLNAPDGHPIQQLWQSKHALAVNQVAMLGSAIAGITKVDKQWVGDHVKNIKENTLNNRRGSMFELIAARLLQVQREKQTVTPTKKSAPGYDLVVKVSDGDDVDVSLKSYGTSTHEQSFAKEAENLDSAFGKLLKSRTGTGAVLMAFASSFPSSSDWQALNAALPTLEINKASEVGIWNVKLGELDCKYGPYSPHHKSALTVAFAPFHANESKNLSDKFDTAFYNAEEHAGKSSGSARIVMMRVPETISLLACRQWATNYLRNNTNSPIDAVFLYQCTVVNENDSNVISHAIEMIPTRRYEAWARATGKRRGLAFDLPVGVGTSPTQRVIVGGPTDLNLDEGYFFQKGDFYKLHVVDPQKPTDAFLKVLASGIFEHAVIQWPDGGYGTVSGHFPSDYEIKLFA